MEAPPKSPSSRPTSTAPTSSLTQWRLAQGTADAQASLSPTAAGTHGKAKVDRERRARRTPQVAFADATERETTSAHNSPSHEGASGPSLSGSHSLEERSYRPVGADNARRSLSDLQSEAEKAATMTPGPRQGELNAVVGDEPVQWSFSSGSPQSADRPLREPYIAESPITIAVAVPDIAQARNSAAEAYADRWTHEVKRSTADEEELLRAYRQLETELRASERRAAAAEARQQRETSALKTQLQSERDTRVKVEKDLEELLSQATLSPGLSPCANALPGGNVLHVSVEGGNHMRSSDSGGRAAAAVAGGGAGGGGASAVATYVREAFYEKMKEREDRARARVRKEFVRQAQEGLYAEQRKTAEAEEAAALATRRLQHTEAELSRTQSALQEANSVMEAKDVQLHERAIHIQELEAQLRLLQRQLESADAAKAQCDQQARRRLEEAQQLADARQRELDAQRRFAQQLQAQLGLKARDLLDQESSQESVLQQVLDLRMRCKALEEDLEARVQEATSLLDQRRQQAETDAAALRERNEVLKKRCAAAEAEVEGIKGTHDSHSKELDRLRERYESALGSQKVEVRSLQLQLERALDAAKHCSAESATAVDIERQQQAALLRKYAAEATAAREELDRTRALMQREEEKHLRSTLELSQQLTSLKQTNTRLEHRVNVYEHESADATRLLARAREDLSRMWEERHRLNLSLADFRADSRMRSVTEGPDILQRRVAELENVRRDLSEKLLEANSAIEGLQLRSLCALEQSSRYSPIDGRSASMHGVGPIEAPSPSRARLPQGGLHADALGGICSNTNGRRRSPFRHSNPSIAESTGLRELLESVVRQLEPIVHPLPRCSLEEDTERESRSSSSLPLSLREWRLLQRQSMSFEEREALGRVLASCTTALRCNVKTQLDLDSPSKRCGGGDDAEGERERGVSTYEGAPAPRQPSSAAQHGLQQKQHSGALPFDLPPPQDLLARPNRSSPRPASSVETDDVAVRFSHTSNATPTRPSERRVAAIETLPVRSSQAEERERQGREHNEASIRRSTDAPLSKRAKAADCAHAAERDDRIELESEQLWDSAELESGQVPHAAEGELLSSLSYRDEQRLQQLKGRPSGSAAKTSQSSRAPPPRPRRSVTSVTASSVTASGSASSSTMQGPRDDSLIGLSSKTRMTTVWSANHASDITDRMQSDGILRYSRIPDEVLLPPSKKDLRDAAAVAPAVADDVAPGLFRNVQYVSVGSSASYSSRHRSDPRPLATSTTPTHSRTEQQAPVPDDRLVIDVREGTPPPLRKRFHVR
ncbi:hypothetical protein ABL78_3677 [Leptomonas seymouri]|uniref:Uncharacterized protein n=1 Tax=Leptomonas seymouri TaxID=5684 RepID=A0A0N1IKV1_LEPSE|nr:hypothetical protein ABL78_3677 [Leptomonas seymouri]|eukprot:KPI87240.1 hypothetical protein ABL78_3677 [Leptomonas seymouri]